MADDILEGRDYPTGFPTERITSALDRIRDILSAIRDELEREEKRLDGKFGFGPLRKWQIISKTLEGVEIIIRRLGSLDISAISLLEIPWVSMPFHGASYRDRLEWVKVRLENISESLSTLPKSKSRKARLDLIISALGKIISAT